MKRYIILLVLAIACVAGSCKKKKGLTPTRSVQQNNNLDTLVGMSAKIDGESWQADSVFGYRVNYGADTGRMDLYVTATNTRNDTNRTISFTITNYTGVNTYRIDPPIVSATYYIGNERHYATGGSIVVTSDDQYGVIGTFNFTADTIIVTDGVFNVAKP